MNAYDLTRQFIEVLGDIDALIEKKGKVASAADDKLLDDKITVLENKMFDIKNKLKETEI